MEFSWSERKRTLNLKEHGLDFIDAQSVFEATTFTYEDDRFPTASSGSSPSDCSPGVPVSIAHTETDHEIRVISFRKATHREAEIYFGQIQD